nr:MAG TPA: hypothetical protein [Caudoviricetes sp.]
MTAEQSEGYPHSYQQGVDKHGFLRRPPIFLEILG